MPFCSCLFYVDSSLLPFFQPKGVVVIGASTSPEKLGYGVVRNLVHARIPERYDADERCQVFSRTQKYRSASKIPDTAAGVAPKPGKVVCPVRYKPGTGDFCGKNPKMPVSGEIP